MVPRHLAFVVSVFAWFLVVGNIYLLLLVWSLLSQGYVDILALQILQDRAFTLIVLIF